MRYGEEYLAADGCSPCSGVYSNESIRWSGRVVKDENFQGLAETDIPTSQDDVDAGPLFSWHSALVPGLFRRHRVHAVLEAANFDKSNRQAEVDVAG